MFKPNNSTITQNMHKVSLQNYATGLPHQRGLEWHGPRLSTMPTRSQARRFDRFSKSGQNLLLLWGKKKEQWFTSRYLHETGTRRGWDPVPAVLPGATQQPPSTSRRAHHPPPSTPIHPKKPILNGKFPRKLRQSWMKPNGVVRN